MECNVRTCVSASCFSALISAIGFFFFFFFNDTATTEIYTLSLHDALPILRAYSSSRITMQVPEKMADQQTYSMALFRSAIHPEFFNIEERIEVCHNGYDFEAWL